MKNKPKTLDQYITYRNTLITRRDARKNKGLRPVDGRDDYYTIRIEEIDKQYPQFKGLGKIKLKGKL